jgi:peroxiredoxin
MNHGLRYGIAAIVSLAAVWAGAQVYLSRFAAPEERGIPVPAGEASATNDRDSATDAAEAADAMATLPPIKIPEKLPDFKLADLDGHLTSVSQWQGKSLMINFWATWCAPCRHEIPLLQSLQAEKRTQNTTVLGIAVDYPDKVRNFRDQYKIGYPLLVGEQDALDLAAALGVASPAFPFTVFTDQRGEIVALYMGELKRAEADSILAVVDDLNKDRIALPAARARISEHLAGIHGKT